MLTAFILCLVCTFLMTVIICRWLIPVLKSKKMGQKILDIGPRWHKSKEGTPTMGGLAFIAAMAMILLIGGLAYGFYVGLDMPVKLILTFLLALFSGLIGIIDDSAKFKKHQNEGLSAPQKFLLQLVVAGAYLYLMHITGSSNTALYIPFVGITVELGIAYYIFGMILIAGMLNSVNLNDGIDGLCSSVTAVVGGFFAVIAFLNGMAELALLSGVCIGGCLGFLVYNFHPARVFMGDTGSLFLGGLVVGMAFMIDNPLLIVIAGFMYILETISVMLQVTYFKFTHGKRLFKMAPIHHHFEQCGYSENKIVGLFSLLTALLCGVSLLGL
ncbi:MAG: phospho-N-acetylmuramoyl-pentapeptide-transferase [Clostridiales bacterium]|nr:phospho-N-acetylmuramoyl-pentapeptide-transferase [Clostridiales bacterium]